MRRLFAHWSLRARVLFVVSLAALAPVAWMALSHWLEHSQRDRTDVELGSALAEAVRAEDDGALGSIAARHQVRVRVLDVGQRRVEVDIDRERGTRPPRSFFGWLYYPSNVPTLQDLDRSWAPIFDRPEVRDAGARASMGCHSDPHGAVLVCYATERAGDRVVYVQRGFVRGAVRASYERNRELGRLALVLVPVALTLGYWLSRRMVRPLEALRAEALARARALDPGAPLVIEPGDEIGDVKQAFNTLLSALRAEKLATEAFVADLAHEAKNPVATIRACAEALATGEDSEERRARIAGNLSRASDRLERLVSDLLDLARIEAGMPRESQTDVDLAELAGTIVEDAKAAQGTLEIVLSAMPVHVRGVPERLDAALRNLVDNAASFGRERVEVEVKREGDRAIVTVKDDGPGIEPELIERVFDRFFTTRGSRSGTGLGLAIVRAVATAHGGRAEVRSQSGQGACFELRLPARGA